MAPIKSVFGSVDRNKEGKLVSQFPSWYFRQQTDELEENIRYKDFQLDNDLVPSSEKNIMRETLNMEKKKLEDIRASVPRFTDAELDELAKVRKSLGTKIGEAMFKRSEIERNLAEAHEEARRMTEFVVKFDEKEISVVRSCEGRISEDGKVSRTTAEKCWKIVSRILQENSNTETLRRP